MLTSEGYNMFSECAASEWLGHEHLVLAPGDHDLLWRSKKLLCDVSLVLRLLSLEAMTEG